MGAHCSLVAHVHRQMQKNASPGRRRTQCKGMGNLYSTSFTQTQSRKAAWLLSIFCAPHSNTPLTPPNVLYTWKVVVSLCVFLSSQHIQNSCFSSLPQQLHPISTLHIPLFIVFNGLLQNYFQLLDTPFQSNQNDSYRKRWLNVVIPVAES